MTVQEIREQVPAMAIWMADATIRNARRALTHNTGWHDIKRHDYNLPEVEMASSVLFNMFNTYEAAIREALIKMPGTLDGCCSVPGMKYFDEFVKALESQIGRVSLRESDWVLAMC